MPELWSRSLDYSDFLVVVKDCVMEGPAGEARLVDALPRLNRERRSTVLAVLGDAQGPRGVDVLREALTGMDLDIDGRCAALLALAKRAGFDASADLAAHVVHPDESVRRYAMHALAVVGDDRAWEQVFTLLERILDRSVPGGDHLPMSSVHAAFEAMVAISYLVRYLAVDEDRLRKSRLVQLLRGRFDRLYAAEQAFLHQHWPGCEPSGPVPDSLSSPDPRSFVAWARQPLFGPVF